MKKKKNVCEFNLNSFRRGKALKTREQLTHNLFINQNQDYLRAADWLPVLQENNGDDAYYYLHGLNRLPL